MSRKCPMRCRRRHLGVFLVCLCALFLFGFSRQIVLLWMPKATEEFQQQREKFYENLVQNPDYNFVRNNIAIDKDDAYLSKSVDIISSTTSALPSDPKPYIIETQQSQRYSTGSHHLFASTIDSKPNSVTENTLHDAAERVNDGNSFERDLQQAADINRQIVLSVIDSGYVTMAINFFRTSLQNVKLANFLLVCIDQEAVAQLHSYGIHCSHFDVTDVVSRLKSIHNKQKRSKSAPNFETGATMSDFGSQDYYHKSNAKTTVVLRALRLGYTVLIIDVDTVLFRNPFIYFNCTTCDAFFQMDREMYNSGFAYVRATRGSILLYETAWELYLQYHKAHDQVYINMAVERLNNNKNNQQVQIQSLSVQLFVCGVYYFEHKHRMFNNLPPCPECVMVHNNYIGSYSAKVYRFKENLLWTIDDYGYYSNASARFITYDNPVFFGVNTTQLEIEALKTGLLIAMLTDRLLILPTFHCCGSCNGRCSDDHHQCSLLSLLRLSTFDKYFRNYYREHSFLENVLVPGSIKNSTTTKPLLINATNLAAMQHAGWSHVRDQLTSLVTDGDVIQLSNFTHGALVDEVRQWILQRSNYTVIKFHSLYGPIINWSQVTPELRQRFQLGFDCSEYEQWDSDLLNLAKMWQRIQ